MSVATSELRPKRSKRLPRIVINEDDLSYIEGLADGAFERNPALADRLLDELARAHRSGQTYAANCNRDWQHCHLSR